MRLPPLMTHRTAPKGGAVLDRAAKAARAGEADAGDVFTRLDDAIAMALILEPDVSRETSRTMLPLGQVAVGEALAAVAPPETEVMHRWDGAIIVNGATVGSVRARMGDGPDGEVPEWLAVGVRLAHAPDERHDPGHAPDRSTLADELGPLDAVEIAEAIARHWMSWLHRWETDGWTPVAREWDARAVAGQAVALGNGTTAPLLGVDELGNAIVSVDGGTRTISLATRWGGGA